MARPRDQEATMNTALFGWSTMTPLSSLVRYDNYTIIHRQTFRKMARKALWDRNTWALGVDYTSVFPTDGKYSDWIEMEDKPGWYRIKYTAGPKDIEWLEEADRNYIARITKDSACRQLSQQESQDLDENGGMKTRNYGICLSDKLQIKNKKLLTPIPHPKLYSKHSTNIDSSIKGAQQAYKNGRMSGNEQDSPKRKLPLDGQLEWTNVALDKKLRKKKYYQIKYTEGQGDQAWMEERNHNYINRIIKESEPGALTQQEIQHIKEMQDIVPAAKKYLNRQNMISQEGDHANANSNISSPPSKIKKPKKRPKFGKKSRKRSSERKQKGKISTAKDQYARALYDYEAEDQEELTFKEKDILQILDDSDPSGWYQAILDGQTGLIPSNYIEVLNEYETAIYLSKISVIDTQAQQTTPNASEINNNQQIPSQTQTSTNNSQQSELAQFKQQIEVQVSQAIETMTVQHRVQMAQAQATMQSMQQDLLEKQRMQAEQQLQIFFEKQTSNLQTVAHKEHIQYQQILDDALSKHSNTGSLSDEQLSELTQTIQQKMSTNPELEENIKKLMNSDQYREQIKTQETRLLSRIRRRQENLLNDFVQIQADQNKLQGKTDPMYDVYQEKQQRIAEQKELQEPAAVCLFYNTIEQVLSARLISAMTLASGLIKREETTVEKGIQMGSKVAGALLQGIPLVGGVISGVASLAGAAKAKSDMKKHENTSDALINFKTAMKVSEHIARRVAQSYRQYIEDNTLDNKRIKYAGMQAAKHIHNYMRSNKMKELSALSIEEKIEKLIQVVIEKAAVKKGGLFKGQQVTASVPNTNQPPESPAQHQQVNDLTSEQQQIKDEIELLRKQVHNAGFFAKEKRLPTNPKYRKHVASEIKEEHVTLLNSTATFHVIQHGAIFSIHCTSNQSFENELKSFGNELCQQFKSVKRFELHNKTLNITLSERGDVNYTGDGLKAFLFEECGLTKTSQPSNSYQHD